MSVELKCVQEYYANGNPKSEEFFNSDGENHNAAGPAYRRWNENGALVYESYWLDDNRHNAAGPAFRRWNGKGELEREEYWLNGKELPKAEWEAAVNPAPCDGKVVEIEVEIEGRKYKLVAVI